jgi:hypothetical protein
MRDNHERSDISVKAVAVFGLGLAVALGLILAAASALVPSAVLIRPTVTPPGPRLQTHPREDLAKLRATEDATLNGYGWVDRKAGIIRIPIERAMELTARRGLADKKEAKP